MSIVIGTKIGFMVSAANGDTYGDPERKIFRGLQALVMPNVISMALNIPPVGPTFLDTYVVGTAPTGLWSGQANNIAEWSIDSQDGIVTTGIWEFYAPKAGWVVYDNNTGAFWTWNGSAWAIYKTPVRGAGNGGVVTATSPTTTLNPASVNSFRVSLNTGASAVNLVISAGAYDGQEITVELVQGGTPTTTITFAANIHGSATWVTTSNAFAAGPSIGTNSVSVQKYAWDSTNTTWYALAPGVSNQ